MATAALCALSAAAHAQEEQPSGLSRSQLFVLLSEALESFDRGSSLLNSAPDAALAAFREARDNFQTVVNAGVENGMLYYNLGNAHLRLGEVGKSIADYRRSARFMPGDEQLKANLRFARSLRRDQIEVGGGRAFLQTVFLWHYSIPIRMRLAAALTLYGLFWILLTVRVTAIRFRLGYAIIVCLVLWVGLGTSVAIELPTHSRLTEGVLIANDVVVRKGNGEGYAPQFKQPLHEGVEFTILEQRGGWIHVELTDGNSGWVREREVDLF